MKKERALVPKQGIARIKSIKPKTWFLLFQLVLLCAICILHALPSGHYADFFPINGTFQNYNPIRRFLNGQVPYDDFSDYLGLGHLYTGSIATGLFGGTYRDSLSAFSFLTFGCLALISTMIGMAIFGTRGGYIAVAITNLLLVFVLVQPLFLQNVLAGTTDILYALQYALGTGNSARFVRGLVLPLSVLLLFFFGKLYLIIAEKRNHSEKSIIVTLSFIIGFVAGFSFSWSNDFGISCWLCLLIMSFWVSLSRYRKIKKALIVSALAILSSFVGVFVSVLLLTQGHVSQWVSSTFGTGGYQSWYYNSTKSYYLYDVDFSWIMLVQALICLYYLIKVFELKGSIASVKRFGVLAFANMVSFCVVNEYKLLSGGYSREVSMSVLFFTIIFELIYFLISENSKAKRALCVMACVVSCAWIVSSIKDECVFALSQKNGVYVEALGGNLTSLGDELIEADQFIGDDKIFATYASAQEVVSGTYQPSGTDYIIHVLGDEQRKNYLDSFDMDDFRYAVTINENYTPWESWAKCANWFFYRKLYEGWHPVYENSYELYWERNNEQSHSIDTGFYLDVQDVDWNEKKIVVQCENYTVNGIADVYIDYEIKKQDRKSSLLVWQEQLKVENTGTHYVEPFYESNYLRSSSAEHIPVLVVNGYGEVTLTSNPEENTYLIMNEVKCERILTAYSDYVNVTSVIDNGDGSSVLSIANRAREQNALNGAKKISYAGVTANILDCSQDDFTIYVHVDSVINLGQGNMIEIVR